MCLCWSTSKSSGLSEADIGGLATRQVASAVNTPADWYGYSRKRSTWHGPHIRASDSSFKRATSPTRIWKNVVARPGDVLMLEAAILSRVIQVEEGDLSRSVAEYLLSIRFWGPF